MQVRTTEKGFIIRLETGENIIETLTHFCEERGLHAGIIHGIGTVQQVVLGAYAQAKKAYEWKTLMQNLEIVSFTGNVALVEQKPFLHIHGIFSDSDLHCYGGHIKEAVVGPTCEVYLIDFQTDLQRVLDDTTGLKLLHCKEE
jgi:predicted DNA-binding protein with PD1-like motif